MVDLAGVNETRAQRENLELQLNKTVTPPLIFTQRWIIPSPLILGDVYVVSPINPFFSG